MDEKIKRDSTLLWTESDSTLKAKETKELNPKDGNWVATTGIVLGFTVLLIVLFNLRSN